MSELNQAEIARLVGEEVAKRLAQSPTAQFRAVGHGKIRCVQSGREFPADHPNPARECMKDGISNPHFIGAGTFFFVPDKKLPHHAEYIPADHFDGLEQSEEPQAAEA